VRFRASQIFVPHLRPHCSMVYWRSFVCASFHVSPPSGDISSVRRRPKWSLR